MTARSQPTIKVRSLSVAEEKVLRFPSIHHTSSEPPPWACFSCLAVPTENPSGNLQYSGTRKVYSGRSGERKKKRKATLSCGSHSRIVPSIHTNHQIIPCAELTRISQVGYSGYFRTWCPCSLHVNSETSACRIEKLICLRERRSHQGENFSST